MSRRRPLGASIEPELRLVVFEAYIRDVHAAIGRLEEAVQALDTGKDPVHGEISPQMAWSQLHLAVVELQELKGHGFRAPRR
jgi:hypothetical protein